MGLGLIKRSVLAVLLSGVAGGAALAGGASSSGSSSCGCAPTTHQVKVPGISISPPSVSIGIPSIGVGYGSGSGVGQGSASASANSSISVNISTTSGGSSSSSSVSNAALLSSFSGGGGGSGSWSPEGGVTTDIPDLKIEQPAPPVTRQVCAAFKAVVRQVAIQAVCLDDKDVPHPASQVSPDRAVAAGYEGEVFRCIAGARMQYTVAAFSGQADFNQGQTVVCRKNEALYHTAAGAVQCRLQTPARDCNERSLLRRYGAGIKVLAMAGAQVCAAYRTETVAATGGTVSYQP